MYSYDCSLKGRPILSAKTPRVVCFFVFNFKISVQEYNLLRITYGNHFWHFYNSTLFYRHVWGIHCWTWRMWFPILHCGSYGDIYSQSVSHTSGFHWHQYLKNIAGIITISFYKLTKYYLPPFLNKLRHWFTGFSLGARGFFPSLHLIRSFIITDFRGWWARRSLLSSVHWSMRDIGRAPG